MSQVEPGAELAMLIPTIRRNDVYPAIEPTPLREAQAYKGKVVFITGASRGIGQETALQYARAGALLALTARGQEALEQSKDALLKVVPDAQVLTFALDVTDAAAVGKAVEATVEKFGRLDVVIANAGWSDAWDKPFGEKDPDVWWRVIEVSVRGAYNVVHYAVPHLTKSEGRVVLVSSLTGVMVLPFASAASIGKHALGRFAEFIVAEYPKVKCFTLHPGAIETTGALRVKTSIPLNDTLALPACTMLALTSGRFDWLSSRFVSSNWDLGEVERDWKKKIIDQNALTEKIQVPK
ncbi:NAD-P-binding protein [Dentipellis sp. KUC8613]|nr:NAD-P-binding protein [Dentipellis sp. KUC8613]